MKMYSVVNVENFKLYEPPMSPSPEYLYGLHEYAIVGKINRTS
jgi:hypothetical protein